MTAPPTSGESGFQSLHTLANVGYSLSLWRHPGRRAVVPRRGWFAFPWGAMMMILFSRALLSRETSLQILCPPFNSVVFLLLSPESYLFLLDTRPLADVWTFSPILGVLFSLSWWCPWNTHGFNFDEVRFISIFQLSHVFLGSYLIEFVFRLMFLSVTFLSQMIWYLEITFSSAPPSDFGGLLGGELFTLSQDSLLRCIYTLLLPTFNAQASYYFN